MKFRINIKRNKVVTGFSNILPDIIDKYNITEDFNLESLKEVWNRIIGVTIGKHSYPNRIYKHTLFIEVDHPIFSNEIISYKKQILKKIKIAFPLSEISNIRTEIKKM